MRATPRFCRVVIVLVSMSSGGAMTSLQGQEPGAFRSLGGYGGFATMSSAGMGAGGPIIPYAGSFGGFMPYRMGSGTGGLSFSSRNLPVMGSQRASLSLAPMGLGMTSMRPDMGGFLGAGLRPRSFLGLGTGTVPGGGPREQMPFPRSMGVMPPSLGYPFYQPPSLAPSAPTAGMSM
jgi:hypothetical protein